MNRINIDINNIKHNDVFYVGHQFDHCETELVFSNLEVGKSYQVLVTLDKSYEISIVDSKWIISNTYTQLYGSFEAQIKKFESGKWIAHSPIFNILIEKSIGNVTQKEEVPPRFENQFQKMNQVIDSVHEGVKNIVDYKNNLDIYMKMNRTNKIYGVKKWKASVNPISECEKIYANKGLVCEPSTDTIEGRDDYADIQLFQYHRVNYKRYDDGFAYPVAWEGEANYNDKDNADVGNIYQTFYYNEIDKGDYTELLISDSPNEALGLRPWEEAVRADGMVMPYFIMSAFEASRGSDGKLYSLPNRQTISHASHNFMITEFQKKGKGYWGAGSNRITFLQIMSQIKYGTKDIQSVMQGCTNYSYQIKASIQSATKNVYFPILKTDKDKFIVGACVSVGYGELKSDGNINIDRGLASMNKYADRVKVTKIQDLDGTNAAVYLDCQAFDTMPITGGAKPLEIHISTMPWWSGTTDKVIGHHDGSWMSNTNSRMPCRVQGIEYYVGRYVIASDTIMCPKSDFTKDVYFAPRGVAHTGNEALIKQTYTKIGTIPTYNQQDFWCGDVTIKNGAWYPSSALATQQSCKDRIYADGSATSGTRQYLQCGYLWHGSYAGSSCLHCGSWLGGANWGFGCAD